MMGRLGAAQGSTAVFGIRLKSLGFQGCRVLGIWSCRVKGVRC